MAYNSAYTGSQVDAAVGAVRQKETIWDGKQDELTGTEDQLVGFNAAGEAVAVAKPTADDVGAVPAEDVGVANGIAELDGNGKLVESQKPTYTADEVGARPDTWTPDAEDVGAMPAVTGGTTGQVLTKTETGQKWSDAPDGLPEGGSEGQVLTKTASGTAWDDVPSDLPAGGTDGQILTKTTDGTAWEDAPSGLPDGGTNGQVLTVGTDGPEWADAILPKSIQITLSTSGWSNNAQTVTVSGVSAAETAQLIQPMPAMASQSAYYAAGILCTNQAANSLTFTCQNVPTEDLTVYVVMQEVGA